MPTPTPTHQPGANPRGRLIGGVGWFSAAYFVPVTAALVWLGFRNAHVPRAAIAYSFVLLAITQALILSASAAPSLGAQETTAQKLGFLKRVLFVNLISCLVARYNTYEFHFPRDFFHISYPFGNYSDFLATVGYVSDANGKHFLLTTGYLPFSVVVADAFSVLIRGLTAVFKPGPTVPVGTLVAIGVYALALALLVALAGRFIRTNPAMRGSRSIILLFFASSYPFFMQFERGNFSIFALIALAIFFLLDEESRLRPIVVMLLVSLKVTYVIFAPLYLLCRAKFNWWVSALLFGLIQVASVLVVVYHGPRLPFANGDYSELAKNIIGSGYFNWPTALITFSTSGLESLRLSFLHIFSGVQHEQAFASPTIKLIGRYVVPAVIAAYGWRMFRNRVPLSVDVCILFFFLVLLFHPMFGDYNLPLLSPFLLYYLARDQKPHAVLLFSLLALCFLIATDIPFMGIDCCGGQYVPDRYVYVTAKPAVICGIALTAIAVLFLRLRRAGAEGEQPPRQGLVDPI
ncbi:MAG TPA: glycosyltransferase 87 family protein [Opitutaceae bacterium]|jgi:hypothetical protein